MAFAETGHLCLSTLHANNANQALDRIINFFPEERRHQLLMDLSLNLKAFISQRLVPTIDGKRVAAIEILLGTGAIQDLIMKGDIHGIKEIMERSEDIGMQTFDRHLFKLYREGIISYDEMIQAVAAVEDGEPSAPSPLDSLELTPIDDGKTNSEAEDAKELQKIINEAKFQCMRKKALMGEPPTEVL